MRWLRGDMMNRELVWNARVTSEYPNPTLREKAADEADVLDVYAPLIAPDSAHRHLGIYKAVQWSLDPKTIPNSVMVDKQPVTKKEIQQYLKSYDPKETFVTVLIYEVKPQQEGKIFHQANDLTKPAGRGAAYDMDRKLTPSIRIIDAIMKKSKILAEAEIERRQTKIVEKSRKITTLSTLTAAFDAHNERLLKYEGEQPEKYEELVDFMVAFFAEYANLFPAFQPSASTTARTDFRKTSYAMQNIMIHPLVDVALRLFDDACKKGDWRQDQAWKVKLARLASKVDAQDDNGNPIVDPKTQKPVKVDIMSRLNPAWRGRIVLQSYDSKTGQPAGWNITNTRQTRRAATDYLVAVVGGQPASAQPVAKAA